VGFMDKAKQLAEQAQQKLDEAQKQFNQGQGEPDSGDAVRYDQHGRPIEGPPAGTTDPPAAEPVSGDTNTSPDPFKPIQ
jgi:hypothetical protein